MLRYLVAALFSLLPAVAQAQAPTITELPPLSGDAIGPGYSAANGTLFIPSSASLVAVKLPLTLSYDMVMPSIGSGTQQFFGTGTTSTGIITQLNPSTAQDFMHLQAQIRPAAPFTTTACNVSGKLCWRNSAINDSTRHHFCYVFASNHAWFYLDGIIRDEITSVGTYGSSTLLWSFFSSNVPTNTSVFDIRVFNKALTADECVYISRLNQVGLIPNSGSTNTDMAMHLPLNNCVVTGPEYNCADTSGNGNNATNAKSPPVVVVTAPSAGTLPPGAVSMTATCTDPSGLTCTQVCYLVDNVQVSSACPTTAPYTFSWDSTKILDGVHVITAVGINISGAFGTSSGITVTTSNGVSAKTVWLNSATGNDSNNCLSSGTSCLTLAHIRSAISLLGGDTFNITGTFSESTPFQLCGPVGGCGAQNFFPSADRLTVTGTGACNPFTQTTTGCAIINQTAAADGFDIINGSNVTVTNLAVLGPANTSLTLNAQGIKVSSTLPAYTSSAGVIITNNIAQNFGYPIDIGGIGVSGASQVTNYTVSDNWATSTPAHVNPGPLTCIRADAGTQGTIQGNLATQCGGQSGNNGNGIAILNYPSPSGTTLGQFNVVHDFGWNDAPNSGGPVGIYTIQADKVTYQFNESYNGLPNPLGHAIDFDCFDIDNGSTNILEQYNYAHNCPNQAAFNISTNLGGANPGWNNNIIRYNIGENNLQCVTFGGNAAVTNSFIYNNTCSTNLATFGITTSICWNLSNAMTLANNLCIYTGTAQTGYTNFAYSSLPISNQFVLLNNDYWATSASAANPPVWVYNKIFTPAQAFTSLSAYQTASIDANHASGLDLNSLNVDPQLTGTPGTGGTCYTDGSGSPPAGPQPCPSAYKLSGGSPLITAGVNVATLPSTAGTPPANPSVDYFGRPVGPTNFSIGASSGQ